ncbi:chloride channel protein [Synechococcus sp. J7-Johnson]|nr:chloride channel protein [Synechococcus sp. J7-Johnson]
MGLLQWPYQALSELGFRLQRWLWPLPGLEGGHGGIAQGLPPGLGAVLVFAASALLIWLAWGPLAAGRGGGVAPLLALDRSGRQVPPEAEAHWLEKLSLASQLQRLPLMLLTHLGGLTVGVESPSVALGASVLLATRRRWPGCTPLAQLPSSLVAVIGGAAGLGAAFRSPLLAVAYGLEELGQRSGLSLVLPALLLAGSGSVVATAMGQPARLPGLELGGLAPALWGWAMLLTLVGAAAGALLVRLLIPAAAWVKRLLARRRLGGALLLAGLLTLLALASGGLSLNDGSLSLGSALAGGDGGPSLTLLWRTLATVLSLAAGAPGGLMHDSMTLGALLTSPLRSHAGLGATELAQLAAVGATALFASAHGSPLFCAAFVFTLQGDPALLPALLLVSAISGALGERWRGEGWNEHQCQALIDQAPGATPSSR